MSTSGTLPRRSGVQLIQGNDADALLKDADFQSAWSELAAVCSWGTSCQTWGFAEAWLSVYHATHEGLLVIAYDESRLVGLLPLAVERASGSLVHVGAHQAEYQVWLATAANAESFIEEALDALATAYPGRRLELQHLPPGSPVGWCRSGKGWGASAVLREKKRPLLALGPNSPVEESLRKKSNKSRINRLKKIAPIRLVQAHTREQLAAVLETIADYCDLRQGAINASLPFRDDPCKKEFCLRLMDKPGITHASVLMLGDTVLAANIGLINRTSVSLGIVVHSPFLAEHSPGKMLILMLARELGQQGFTDFDLTPGGDMYKDRSADHADQVYVLRVCFDHRDYLREAAKERIRQAASHVLGRHGPRLAARVRQIGRPSWSSLPARAARMLIRTVYDREDTRYYVVSSEQARQIEGRSMFRVNCIADLLCYEPVNRADRSKSQFLLEASQRLEAGGQVYTLVENGILLHCGWISLPPKGDADRRKSDALEYPPDSCLLWDDYTHPEGHGRRLPGLSLEQRLHDAAMLPGVKTILIKVEADESRAADGLGGAEIRYFGTLTRETRFGTKHCRLSFGQ